VGHAVEAAGDYTLLHGEAIAIGMIAAALIEIELGLAEPGRLDRVRTVLEKLGVPVKLPPNLGEDRLMDVMKHDKKAVDQWPRFVLVDRLGQVHQENGQYAVPVARDVIQKVLKKLAE
jgi:3-dehydroquinate synthetase